MSYFSYFPRIRYNDRISLNLLVRAKVLDEVLNKRDIYYQYVIRENEFPDTLADRFYGDPERDWIIYFTNSITDPYSQWPLGYRDFNRYLEKKYNKPAFETKSDIAFYRYTGLPSDDPEDIARKSWTLSPFTYNNLSPQEQSGWTPVTVYDHEDELNEQKRVIRVIQNNYVGQILREIESILR